MDGGKNYKKNVCANFNKFSPVVLGVCLSEVGLDCLFNEISHSLLLLCPAVDQGSLGRGRQVLIPSIFIADISLNDLLDCLVSFNQTRRSVTSWAEFTIQSRLLLSVPCEAEGWSSLCNTERHTDTIGQTWTPHLIIHSVRQILQHYSLCSGNEKYFFVACVFKR